MRHNEQNPGSDGEHDSEGEALKLYGGGKREWKGEGETTTKVKATVTVA